MALRDEDTSLRHGDRTLRHFRRPRFHFERGVQLVTDYIQLQNGTILDLQDGTDLLNAQYAVGTPSP